jgi:hypothetical protein
VGAALFAVFAKGADFGFSLFVFTLLFSTNCIQNSHETIALPRSAQQTRIIPKTGTTAHDSYLSLLHPR